MADIDTAMKSSPFDPLIVPFMSSSDSASYMLLKSTEVNVVSVRTGLSLYLPGKIPYE